MINRGGDTAYMKQKGRLGERDRGETTGSGG